MPNLDLVKTLMDYGPLGAGILLLLVNVLVFVWMMKQHFVYLAGILEGQAKTTEAVENIYEALK